jgi:hypothetical protein
MRGPGIGSVPVSLRIDGLEDVRVRQPNHRRLEATTPAVPRSLADFRLRKHPRLILGDGVVVA